MPYRRHHALALAVAPAVLLLMGTLLPAAARAQQSALPPVRQLGAAIARSEEPLGAVSTAVPLPGGKVLVNDILRRRVVLFDSTLALRAVVADSTSATANAYGARGGGLLSFGGDSALFIDPASLSMMVVNADGELTNVRAVPRAQEIGLLVGGPNGRPGFDAAGRMVYRGVARGRPAARNARPAVGNVVMPELPDSAPVVRVELATRALDTLAMVRIPRVDVQVTQGNDGRMNVQRRVNPLPVTDDWALLADGSIAVVRGHDFHVDRVAPDGSVRSSGKLPFEWQRLTDEDKQRVLDSARVAMDTQRGEAIRIFGGGAGAGPGAGPGGGVMGGGRPGSGGGPPQRGAAAGARVAVAAGAREEAGGAAGGPGAFRAPVISMVPADQLPDYRPPFGQQAALGDLEGNLWVRTSAPVGEHGPVYYVIDPQDQVVDRIQLPQGRMVAGFGAGGLVYLAFRDGDGNARLESARWK
jgi:hypothetical protein